MFDRDGGREAVDLVEVRLLHHLQELAGIGRERFHVTALALGVDGVEGERGFARAREPVNTTSRSRGISMFLRLCSRAPRIAITRAPSADAWRRRRPGREVVHTVRRAINMGEAKAVIPTRPKRRSAQLSARSRRNVVRTGTFR